MEKSELEKILKLSEKIDKTKSIISQLDRLMGSCNLNSQISATPPGKFSPIEYHFNDVPKLKEILEGEKLRLQSKLTELEFEFSKISVHFN